MPRSPHDPSMQQHEALSTDELRWNCSASAFEFETTAEVEPTPGVIGQESAVEALRFGLRTNAEGQNVFVRGLSGTGRMTLVQDMLSEMELHCPPTPDRAFVHDFDRPGRPALVELPPGTGGRFRKQVEALVEFIGSELGKALSSEVVRARKNSLDRQFATEMEQITKPFDEELRERELAVVSVEAGGTTRARIAPLIDGQPATAEQVEAQRAAGKITDEQIEALEERIRESSSRMEEIGQRLGEVRGRHEQAARELFETEARELLTQRTAAILAEFPCESAGRFLSSVVEDVVERRLPHLDESDDFTALYGVNVIQERRGPAGCPRVVENAPTTERLLGGLELTLQESRTQPPHMAIRGGSLLLADGGYLILDARDILARPAAWSALVRTLRAGELEIVPTESSSSRGVPAVRPEPIPIQVKVVLIGDAYVYGALNSADPDFPHLFKVLADFDSTIDRSPEGIRFYAGVLARLAREEELPAFHREAVAVLVEHGARIASAPERLTSRFGRLADLAREAAFLAGDAERDVVTATDVRDAIHRSKSRADLPARKFRELVARGTIHVQTQGKTVGQVNGLAVISAGPLTYGFPARITATVAPGSGGAINIEREANLSGAIHTKSFYILGGLLRHLLATDHPLVFDASVAFEQSYGGIDGDSASGAEVCCLLSALTDVPIRQDLAMTGAIDQFGNVMPIGAVNEKIEGFFDTCVDAGLTGTQGVIVPRANVGELMLREDVVEACAAGRFHVHAVNHVCAALELFTGLPAGERTDKDRYPDGTVLARAQERARLYWSLLESDHGSRT